jgi:hypothetical protein
MTAAGIPGVGVKTLDDASFAAIHRAWPDEAPGRDLQNSPTV